jgi:hypothetical protein
VKPNKTKKDTFKVKADVHVDSKHTVIEVDASPNKDKTVNIHGTITSIQGTNKVTHPIDIENYKMGTPMPMLM